MWGRTTALAALACVFGGGACWQPRHVQPRAGVVSNRATPRLAPCTTTKRASRVLTLRAGRAADALSLAQLTALLPAKARGALLITRAAFSQPARWLAALPDLQRRLARLLHKRIGRKAAIDPARVRGAVLYLVAAQPSGRAQIALLVRYSHGTAPATLGRAAVRAYLGVGLVELAAGQTRSAVGTQTVARAALVAALAKDTLIIGTERAVRHGIARALGLSHALAAGDPIAGLLAAAPRGAVLVGAVDLTALPRLAAAASSVGAAFATLHVERGGRLTVRLRGNVGRLASLTAAYRALATTLQLNLYQGMVAAERSGGLANAASSIIAYHIARDLLREAAPRLEDGVLTSRLQLPRVDLARAPALALLVAVGWPAARAAVRRARADEATEAVARLRAAVSALYEKSRDKRRFRFPSAPWTPARACCDKRSGLTLCPANARAFTRRRTWRQLGFTPAGALRYRYRLVARGVGPKATLRVEVRGDQDCNGTEARFELRVRVGDDGMLRFEPLKRERELD